MYSVVAVSGYRSLRDVRIGLGRLTVVTGPNGSGKSSLYRAMRLLAECGQGHVIASLAREGGLESALWAGPATLGGARTSGRTEGTTRKGPVSLLLGIGGDELGYLVDLGLPQSGPESFFARDPEVKREAVFAGPVMRPATVQAKRRHGHVEVRDEHGTWRAGDVELAPFRSLLTEYADPAGAPEVWAMRSRMRAWRFYDGFRTDALSPARQPHVGTRTQALADDGSDVAAALATIIEDGRAPIADLVDAAFEGSRLDIAVHDGLFDIALHQPGMLRPLRSAELSDGTLRYLLWLAALLTPAPPPLMVLNEPETSLHPSLLPALARLVAHAVSATQVVVVTHSATLIDALHEALGPGPDVEDDDLGQVAPWRLVELRKDLGETLVVGQGLLTTPAWEWGRR